MYSQAQMEQLIFLKLHYARLVWLVNLMTIYSEAEEKISTWNANLLPLRTLHTVTLSSELQNLFYMVQEESLYWSYMKEIITVTTQDHYDIKSLTLS